MKIFSSFNGIVWAQQEFDYSAKNGYKETVTYSPSSYNYLVNLEALVHIKRGITKNRVRTLNKGMKIFFSKSARFSRMKFRNWAKTHGISIVRDPRRADVTVVDFTAFNSLLSNITKLKIHTGGVGLYWGIFQYQRRFLRTFTGKQTFPGNISEASVVSANIIKDSDIEALESLVSLIGTKSKFITSKELADLVFTENMEEDSYKTVLDMIGSDEQSDIELGIEFLSNYSWINSAYYIARTFYHYHQTIYNSKTAKSVTFAHLKPMFDKYCDNFFNDSSKTEFVTLFEFLAMYDRQSLIKDEYIITSIREELNRELSNLNFSLGRINNLKLIDINVEISTGDSSPVNYRIEF